MKEAAAEDSLRTAWSVIRSGQGAATDATARRRCLEYLARTYREPAKAMVRAWGVRDEHEMEDLVQEYFARFIERKWLDDLDEGRGSFRGFLRASVRHFLLNEKRRAQRRPPVVSLPGGQAEALASKGPTPEEEFDRAWARVLMGDAVEAFREACRADGLDHYYGVFERHVLRPDDHGFPTYQDTAKALGKTPKDVENHLARARRKFVGILRERIRATVPSEDDVEAELLELRRCYR